MIVTTIDKTPQCDGACEAHTGALRMVLVQGWGKFLYCDAAVKEDAWRGLVVSDFVEVHPPAIGADCKCEHWQACNVCHPTYEAKHEKDK